MTKTKELEDVIAKSGLKYGWIAEQLGLSYYGFRKKVSGENEFKVSEITQLAGILGLDKATRDYIFLS